MKLPSLLGIPIHLHSSMVLMFVGIMGYGAYIGGWKLGLLAGVLSVVLFACVLLHELGHAIAALRFDIDVQKIVLYPWGGAAYLKRSPTEPFEELIVALAGPAVNLVLAGVFALGRAVLFDAASLPWLLAGTLVQANMLMAVMNLVPAFPMDGGRALRALMAMRMDWLQATRYAINIGTLLAGAFILGGLYTGYYSIAATGGFLLWALKAEREEAHKEAWRRATGSAPPWDKKVQYPKANEKKPDWLGSLQLPWRKR